MINQVHFGDCRTSLRAMAAAGVKVQTCVTSPPYFGLRDYGHTGQIGLEPTPDEYIAELVEVFRCVRDVLADDGTLWINIGDSYATDPKGKEGGAATSGLAGGGVYQTQASPGGAPRPKYREFGLKKKDLIGIPWMLAFALRADGWYLRQDIIWHKPNPMPESVTDRCTKAHEYVFLLSKGPRYFYDAEGVKEQAVGEPPVSRMRLREGIKAAATQTGGVESSTLGTPADGKRNRRSVWTIATRPYKGAHFAVFPPALVEPCILAGTSERGHCPVCGARWVRQVERPKPPEVDARDKRMPDTGYERSRKVGQAYQNWLNENPPITTGWAPTCQCGVDPVPDVVLDPFMGSGTTAAVAIEHGRRFIGCELNETYKPLQDERINNAYAGDLL
jgi:DNA modification methylase